MLVALLPRRVRFLIAEKSMHRTLIGRFARVAGCISVKRQSDVAYDGMGVVRWQPVSHNENCRTTSHTNERKNNTNDGTVKTSNEAVRQYRCSGGICDNLEPSGEEPDTRIYGEGTRFLVELRPGYKLFLGGRNADGDSKGYQVGTVKEIFSDNELTVSGQITTPCPPSGVVFSVEPKVDQSDVYDAVSESLKAGDTIGIFPEGRSHDRTTFLPLKPGVAVMALCSVLEGAEDVLIVPVGLTYHQADKFQSRATLNIGMPISVSEETAQQYQRYGRATATKLLNQVEEGMRNCVSTAEDHDTMACVKLCANLFSPERLRLGQDKYHSLTLRFSKLFWTFGSEQKFIELKAELQCYKRDLQSYGILDEEVWHLKHSTGGATLSLVEKCSNLALVSMLGVPLVVLWAPLALIAYWLTERHRVMALAGSKVKIRGTDVLASYKILVLMVVLPLFNLLYGLLFGMALFGPSPEAMYTMITSMCILPFLFYVSLRNTEKIGPLFRQIKILVAVISGKINVWRDTERKLITHRIEVQLMVRNLVEEFGPLLSASFLDSFYQCIPKVVLESDTKRLVQKRDEWSPIVVQRVLESREEIL